MAADPALPVTGLPTAFGEGFERDETIPIYFEPGDVQVYASGE